MTTFLPAKFARLSGASLLWLFIVCVLAPSGFAQSARDTVLEVTATTSPTAPCITLNWTAGSNVTAQKLWRRDKGAASWGTAITLGAGDTSYADSTALPGVAYEYSLQRTRSSAPTTVYGAIVAGVNIPLVESRGNVCLLVDMTMATPLAPELAQLEKNLAGDGWTVFRHDVPRETVAASSANSAGRIAEQSNIRSIVQADYNSAPTAEWALLIVGRVPVPYSGNIAPDGHVPDHLGAWPTDGYYADVNGTWTDTSSGNSGNANDARNDNIAGDGKFDQASFPTTLEMQAGRVDLANMTGVPTGQNEVGLLRQYLVRDHRFRRGLAPYNTVAARALIDDNFGYFSGEAFSHSSWRAAISFFGRSTGQVDALDWFGTLGTTSVLFAYGAGGGSYTSAGGVGTSTLDFGRKDSKGVFCGLFGSYFGDWDVTNNFLRAPLAGTQDSLGLTNAWSGRGQVHYHHMALGETIGYAMRYTQNATTSTGNGDWFKNGSQRGVQTNLMGDPTLRLHTVRPVTGLFATSGANVLLTWQHSPDPISGYHVYRATSASGPFTRISGLPTSATDPLGDPGSSRTFTDTAVSSGTTYHYRVTAVRLETSMSGTYANQSCGESVSITHGGTTPAAPTRLAVSGTGTTSYHLTWDDNANNETGYEVQRRHPTTGVWSTIASPGVGGTSLADSAAVAGGPNHYRVRAIGASGNSAFSHEVSDPNQTGIARIAQDYTMVSKTAGTLAYGVLRFSGSHGVASVSRATTNLVSSAADYSGGGTGTLNWSHAQGGAQNVNFDITNHAVPQLTKVFRVDISSPSGAALGSPATGYVQIFDPATQHVIPPGWESNVVGTVTQAGYGEYYNGGYGISAVTGNISGTADSFRGFHRQVTGGCRMTARLVARSAAANATRAGLMIRSSLDADAVMCSAVTTSATAIQRAFRSALAGTADTAVSQSGLALPLWLRLTWFDENVTMERSSDGIDWTAVGAPVTLSNLGGSPYVSLVMASNTSSPEIYGCAQFDNVAVLTVPVVPIASAAGGAEPGRVLLNWGASSGAEVYSIERSTSSGSGFVPIGQVATTSFTDSNLTVGQTYYYRVRGENPAFQGNFSDEVSAQPHNPPTVDGWRYRQFGTTANTGNAADLADPDKDGLVNLLECKLGQSPSAASMQTLVGGSMNISGSRYLTLTFVHDPSVTGVQFQAESGTDLTGTWTTFDPLAPANQVSVQNDTPSAGLQTIRIKDVQAIPAGGNRFLRLRATRP